MPLSRTYQLFWDFLLLLLLLPLTRNAALHKIVVLDVSFGHLPQILKAVAIPLEVLQLLQA